MTEQNKTITIDNDPDTGVSSVTVEQISPDAGLEIGGVKLSTDLPWYGDAAILLFFAALIYIVKKYIDRWFEKKKNGNV